MKLVLLKKWDRGDVVFQKGDEVEVGHRNAQEMIAKWIAKETHQHCTHIVQSDGEKMEIEIPTTKKEKDLLKNKNKK